MTEEELKKQKITIIDEEESEQKTSKEQTLNTNHNLNDYVPLLEQLKAIKTYLSAAPTKTPRNLLEQFEIVDNGVNVYLYIYVNKTRGWRSITII